MTHGDVRSCKGMYDILSAGNMQPRLSEDTNDSGDNASRPHKGGKKGRNGRQRAFESACPSELRNKLQDADLQGLVIEYVTESLFVRWFFAALRYLVSRLSSGFCCLEEIE
jgi:hypothetical protein